MALDGVAINALTKELCSKLSGTKIEKIYQPARDELLIITRDKKDTLKLFLSANASIPRAYLYDEEKGEQKEPPVFCMLLRKHLSGGRIVSVSQPDFERIIRFTVETYNELGDLTQKNLITELMGRHSNIILTDENEKILDSIKRIDFSVSTMRQILPGLIYQSPPSQNKKNPLMCGIGDFLEILENAPDGEKADKCLLSGICGISPLTAREIVYKALGDTSKRIGELTTSDKIDISSAAFSMFREIAEGKFSPCIITDKETKKQIDFSAIKTEQYENMAHLTYFTSPSQMLTSFYKERGRAERNARRNGDILKLVTNNIERCAKKIELQTHELSETENRESYRIMGELITANMYRIKQGESAAEVENYFEDGAPKIKITLDTTLSPAANAQMYFKKYSKAKTAAEELTKQIALAKEELYYLESVAEETEKAESTAELAEIVDELTEQGYMKPARGAKKKNKISMPREEKTPDGFTVLIGKNNKQNDLLTFKTAHGGDLWFHTKNIHGSHVVLRRETGRAFSDEAITAAAELAALFSKAKDSQNVPVDYTEIKYVKKPAGAKPGFVIYTSYKTVYVTPRKNG